MTLNRRIDAIKRYFTQDIWILTGEPGNIGSRLHDVSRWAYLVVHGFMRDQCLIRASALTYTTILSVVPFFAVAFSISKGLGLQNTNFMRMALEQLTAGKTAVVDQILVYINNTNVQTLGFVGMGMLLVSVFLVVGNVEKAFNTIWGVKGRSLWRKFTDFFSVTLVAPVVMALSSSLAVGAYEGSALYKLMQSLHMDFVAVAAFKAAPLVIIWFLFTFTYMFFPNTRVKFIPAVTGGVLAGTVWQLAQWGYIHYQVGVHKYNAIYGSFSQLPLFLVWVYFSWVLVLVGAEITYALQHLKTFLKERSRAEASCMERQKLALMLLIRLTRCFMEGRRPESVDDFSVATGAPARLLADIMHYLEKARLVVKAEDPEQDVYVLGRPPGEVRIADVMASMSTDGGKKSQFFNAAAFPKVEEMVGALLQAVRQDGANVTLEQAVHIEQTQGASNCGVDAPLLAT
jgi:membrane protein